MGLLGLFLRRCLLALALRIKVFVFRGFRFVFFIRRLTVFGWKTFRREFRACAKTQHTREKNKLSK